MYIHMPLQIHTYISYQEVHKTLIKHTLIASVQSRRTCLKSSCKKVCHPTYMHVLYSLLQSLQKAILSSE